MHSQINFLQNDKRYGVKRKLKKKFAVLTDNDLLFKDGKKDEMLGKLQVKLGKTKEQLQTIISSL
jgi:uncharacterized protein YjbJ (UPF0337 family)